VKDNDLIVQRDVAEDAAIKIIHEMTSVRRLLKTNLIAITVAHTEAELAGILLSFSTIFLLEIS